MAYNLFGAILSFVFGCGLAWMSVVAFQASRPAHKAMKPDRKVRRLSWGMLLLALFELACTVGFLTRAFVYVPPMPLMLYAA